MVTASEADAILKSYFTIANNSNNEFESTWDEATQTMLVKGNLTLVRTTPKLPVSFSEVDGEVRLSRSGLTTLEGCPRKIKGNFLINHCSITTLKGGPETVDGYYDACNNQLVSLEGMAQDIGGQVILIKNNLPNLIGCPDWVGDDMSIVNNPLTSLEGFPSKVVAWIYVSYTPTLPLLRLLGALHVELIVAREYGGSDTRTKLQQIMNDYRWIGRGRAGAWDCRQALKKAGFEGNAKW